MKDNTRVQTQRSSKGKTIALWSLQILVAAAFLMGGFAKLSGQPMMVQMFEKIGIGQWFRYVTGTIELVSAILLLVPRVVAVGAALLVCTMCGAVLTHLVKLGGSPLPALVLGGLAAFILWLRFDGLKALTSQPKPVSTGDNPMNTFQPTKRKEDKKP